MDVSEGMLTMVVHYPTIVLESTLVDFAQMEVWWPKLGLELLVGVKGWDQVNVVMNTLTWKVYCIAATKVLLPWTRCVKFDIFGIRMKMHSSSFPLT